MDIKTTPPDSVYFFPFRNLSLSFFLLYTFFDSSIFGGFLGRGILFFFFSTFILSLSATFDQKIA